MKGYFRREAETRLHFTNDGWLRTGDVGYLHAGELYVVGASRRLSKKRAHSTTRPTWRTR